MLTSTDYDFNSFGLLVPRDKIGIKEVDAGIELLVKDIKLSPVVITSDPNPPIFGFVSGGRSGLYFKGEDELVLKGGGIEQALEEDGVYLLTYITGQPLYGQLLEDSWDEVKLTFKFNELMREKGFPTVHEPVAVIDYRKLFQPQAGFNSYSSVPQLYKLGASIMRTKGDTRLFELLGKEFKDGEAAGELGYRLGLIAGAQMKVSEELIPWGTGSHIGNLIVFYEDDQVYLSRTDFIDLNKPRHFNSRLNNGSEPTNIQEAEYLLGTLEISSFNGSNNGLMSEESRRQYANRMEFVNKFGIGFWEAYDNPDKVLPITDKVMYHSISNTPN